QNDALCVVIKPFDGPRGGRLASGTGIHTIVAGSRGAEALRNHGVTAQGAAPLARRSNNPPMSHPAGYTEERKSSPLLARPVPAASCGCNPAGLRATRQRGDS